MESNIQSSFIPHDAGAPKTTRRTGSSGVADLALMLAVLAFAAAAALSVGVFLYQQYVSSIANSDLGKLKSAEQQYQQDIALIQQLQQLDDRMHAGEQVLAAHNAPTAFFDLLDQVTAKTVQYTSLKFDASDPQKVTLDMDGIGQSTNSVAFQSDLLAQAQFTSGVSAFETPIFSNLDHQKDGVHFHLSAQLNSAVLSYESLVGASPATAAPAAATPPAPTPTPAATSPFGGAPPAQ